VHPDQVAGEIVARVAGAPGHEVLAVTPVAHHVRRDLGLLVRLGPAPAEGHPVAAPALEHLHVLVGKPDEGEDHVSRQRVGQSRDQVGAARRDRGDKIAGLSPDLGFQHRDPAGGEGLDVVHPDPGVLGRVAVGHGRGGTETLRQDLLGSRGEREDRGLGDAGRVCRRIFEDGVNVGVPGDDPHIYARRVERGRLRADGGQGRVGVGQIVQAQRVEALVHGARAGHRAPPVTRQGLAPAVNVSTCGQTEPRALRSSRFPPPSAGSPGACPSMSVLLKGPYVRAWSLTSI
jgi:hypothetical protein